MIYLARVGNSLKLGASCDIEDTIANLDLYNLDKVELVDTIDSDASSLNALKDILQFYNIEEDWYLDDNIVIQLFKMYKYLYKK